MAAQPVYPIGLGMFTPMVAMPVAGDSQGVSDMAAPQLVMLANVALTSEGTSCECLTEEKQMVELKTVESGSYSDSEDEALARFSGFDSPAEESAVVYPEVQPAPECQAVVERVAEEPRSDHEVVAEPLEQEQSPSGMGKRKRIQRPVEPPKKKKPFHCKPCQYQAECEEDFVHHIRRHSAKKLIVVNGAEGEGVAKDSPSNADGGEGLVYAKGVIRCERCGYNTNRYDHYLAHLKHHTKEGESQRVYKCTICTYTTISQYHWKKHLRNHFPSKLYTCAQCCYFSDRKNNYVQHIRTHTGERPFRCPYCKYSSSQKTHLTRHMRTHSGERPFKCETCSYLAANQHEVTRHARQVHNGPKPLSCPHCQYKTADRSNYKKHVELHINPRQFLCPVCSYAASKKCNLQYHIKSRHPDCSEITMDVSKVKLRVKKPDSSSTYYNVDGDGQYVLTGIKERKGQLEKKFVRQGNAVTDDQQTPINLSVRKPARPAPAPIVEKERKDKTPKRGEQVPEKAGAGKAEKGFTEEKGMEKQNTQKVEKCERVVRSGGRTAKMEKADCDGKQAEGGLEKMEKKKEKEAKRTAKAPRAVDVAEVKTPSKRGRKSVKPASTEGKVKMEKVEKKKAKAERERVDKERTEKARVEKERAEKRVEKERVEREGAGKERTDREKQEKEQAERQRVEKERVEKEQVEREENERAEREEKERAERERVENERAERERVEKERAEKERVEKEQAETAERERVEKERAEKERVEKEQAETAERESVEKEKTEREKAEAKNRKTVKSVKNAFRRSVKVVKKNQDQGRDSEYWEVPRKTERMEVPSSYGKRKAEDTELSSHKQEASEQPFVSRKSKRRKDEDTPLQRANTLRSRRKVLPTCQASKGKNDGLDLPTVIQLPRKTKKAQSKKKQSPSLVEPYGADKTIVAQEFVVENPAIKTQAPAMEAEHQAFIETASTAQEIPVNKEQCKGVQALLGLLRNPGESVTEERRTEMEHGEVSSAPKDIPEARGSVSEPQKGDSGGPSSPLELPRTSHKPAETEEDEGIHSHDGSDISDNVSEGSDDSGLSGSGKLAGPETPTEEAPPSVTPTALPSHTCIFCDRTFPMEVEYRRHLNRHLVNVYYLENAAAEKQ